VQVLAPLLPCCTLRLAGLQAMLKSGVGALPQASNLKVPMRVAQLDEGEYWVVNQKVQSSAGSTTRLA
jgi:hypothetical protein